MQAKDDAPHTARLFTNGRSQAVRIPRALEFEGVEEVAIRREGDRLIIEPAKKSWLTMPDPPEEDTFCMERLDFDADRVRF